MNSEEINSTVSSLRFRILHNSLRILMSLDPPEVRFLNLAQTRSFYKDPVRFFMRCDDETAAFIFHAIELRQPEELRPLDEALQGGPTQ